MPFECLSLWGLPSSETVRIVFEDSDSIYTLDLCRQEWEDANIIELRTDLGQLKVFEKLISIVGLSLAKILEVPMQAEAFCQLIFFK